MRKRPDGAAAVVLISYSHDSPAHEERVLELAERLTGDGVFVHLDQWEESPPEGWPLWMSNCIEDSDFVIAVCTEPYLKRVTGRERSGVGKGARYEGTLITQTIYETDMRNEKVLPLVLSKADLKHIPKFLAPSTRYVVEDDDGYEQLYRRITSQPAKVRPPLGRRRELPPVSPKQAKPRSSPGKMAPEPVSTHPPKSETLVMIVDKAGKSRFVNCARIESGGSLKMEFEDVDAETSAFFKSILDTRRDHVILAYGFDACRARCRDGKQVVSAGKADWTIEFEVEQIPHDWFGEVTIGRLSPDEIAKMRAERVLLNKHPPPKSGGRVSSRFLDDALVEGYLRGGSTSRSGIRFELKASPLPLLYKDMRRDEEFFLAAARLVAIVALRMTNTVEHVHKLDMKMNGRGCLAVDFKGTRGKRYSNEEPATIVIKGFCPLRVTGGEPSDM